MAGTKNDIFYWSDWMSDLELRTCSLAARGVWMDLLCIAATSRDRGFVLIGGKPPTMDVLADLIHCPADALQPLVDELIHKGVAGIDRRGVIYNRRMVNAEKKRRYSVDGGKKGGPVSLAKQKGIHAPRGTTRHPMEDSLPHTNTNTTSPTTQFYDPQPGHRGGGGGGDSGFGGGGANRDKVPTMPVTERLERFAAKLLPVLRQTAGPHADRMLLIAQDRKHPDHVACIRACKAAAKTLGKGWPNYWPIDRASNLPSLPE